MKAKPRKYRKSAQEVQDEIFRKMPAAKKLRLASEFSMFLLELHKLNNAYELRGAARKSSRNS